MRSLVLLSPPSNLSGAVHYTKAQDKPTINTAISTILYLSSHQAPSLPAQSSWWTSVPAIPYSPMTQRDGWMYS
ncbi:uncharacterized protein BDV14DRAFT_178360 [Aspergillus stella-maris]|uniref:uncharacterized protein n=1 Tax=Aspergillus stella-maris TaxID=1810926 RepID=UPI003CCD9C41